MATEREGRSLPLVGSRTPALYPESCVSRCLSHHRNQSAPAATLGHLDEFLRVTTPIHELRRREEPPADQAEIFQAIERVVSLKDWSIRS
jgi:hypothetical protein